MLPALMAMAAGLLSRCSHTAAIAAHRDAARQAVQAVTADQLIEYPTGHLTNISQVIPPGYDKSAFPQPADGGTMFCFLRLGVENILSIDEHNGVVRYQVFLSVYWPDPRLKLPDFDEDVNSVTMDPSVAEKLWLPDLIIYNLEDVQSVRLLQDLGSLKLLRNGYLKYELYLRTSVICNMDFTSYPFDVQQCDIEIGSYSYNSSVVSWNWMNGRNIYSYDSLKLKSFTVLINKRSQKLHCYGDKHDVCFQNVMVHVELRRHTVFFLWHTLLPCVLLVATSWLSMMLPPEIIPGRMVLCITSLLALLTLFTSSLTGLEVSYIRASDIWYVGCLIFDFLIILEYVILIFVQRQKKSEVGEVWARSTKIYPTEKTEVKKMDEEGSDETPSATIRLWQRFVFALEDSARLDSISRIVLALLFVCFSLGYAGYYTLF